MPSQSNTPREAPPLPAALLEAWPVIAVGAGGWLIATVAAFVVPTLASWRPVTVAGLGVGLLGTGIFLWQRDAVRRGARGAQTGLDASRPTGRADPDETAHRGGPMAAPLLQAQIDIDAPAAKVWALIADFKRMPQWSPQCRWMKPLGALRAGTRTVNINRRGYLFWPTSCVVTEVVPEQKLAFRVTTNGSVWSYQLEPTATGTRVIESRHAENGVTAVSRLATKAFMGGATKFERELVDGMNASLRRIKAAAEGS